MSRRAHISLRTKLASALLMLGHVPYSDAKLMTADQLISLFQWDHGILHAIEVNDAYWNLTPRLIIPHRRKSGKDKGTVSKVVRLERATAEAQARLLAKEPGRSARPKSKWPKRKMQSRNQWSKPWRSKKPSSRASR